MEAIEILAIVAASIGLALAGTIILWARIEYLARKFDEGDE